MQYRSLAHNVFGLCVRAGLLARMFKVSTEPRLTQNPCYAYVWRLFSTKLKLKHKKKNLK